MGERCRLCTSNDRDGLVAEIAQEMWEHECPVPWDRASPQWHRQYQIHADAMLRVLEREHR